MYAMRMCTLYLQYVCIILLAFCMCAECEQAILSLVYMHFMSNCTHALGIYAIYTLLHAYIWATCAYDYVQYTRMCSHVF